MTGLSLLPELVVEPFNRADLRVLFPIMQMAEPDLDLARWMAFASKLARRRDGRAGILVARRAVRRFPCGVVCFRLLEDLRFGSVVQAENMVAIDPIDPHSVLQALIAQLDEIARALGATAVRVIAPDARASVELRRAGHEGDGAVMVHTLPVTPRKTEVKPSAASPAQLPR